MNNWPVLELLIFGLYWFGTPDLEAIAAAINSAAAAINSAAAALAGVLLVLAVHHRRFEEGASDPFYSFAPFLMVTLRFSLGVSAHRRFQAWLPAAAFYLLAGSLVLGLAGVIPLAFAGAFALADRQISHRLLGWWSGFRSPGIESGPAQSVLGLALMALDPSLWGSLLGAGALLGFLASLWLYGVAQRTRARLGRRTCTT